MAIVGNINPTFSDKPIWAFGLGWKGKGVGHGLGMEQGFADDWDFQTGCPDPGGSDEIFWNQNDHLMCTIHWMLILQFWTYPTWLVVDIFYTFFFNVHTLPLVTHHLLIGYVDLSWLMIIYDNYSFKKRCKCGHLLDISHWSHLQSETTWTLTVSPCEVEQISPCSVASCHCLGSSAAPWRISRYQPGVGCSWPRYHKYP